MSEMIAVFLDRDGTIIAEENYPRDPEKVVLLSRSKEALHLMKKKGYLLYVISNQSGLGRGIIRDDQFQAVHERFCEILKSNQIEISGFAYCFHRPEDLCDCRKPKTGLVPKSFDGKSINLKKSYMVGDRVTDLQLGDEFGGKSYLVTTGCGEQTLFELQQQNLPHGYKVVRDLLDVALDLPEVASD